MRLKWLGYAFLCVSGILTVYTGMLWFSSNTTTAPGGKSCKLLNRETSACWIEDTILSKDGQFYKTLTAKADKDNIIMLASVDSAFANLAINYYQTSIKRFSISNFLFICSDHLALKLLQEKGIDCFLYAQSTKNEDPSKFGTIDFMKKQRVKVKMVMAALTFGFTIVLSDVDMIFLRNPMSKLKTGADISFMNDNGQLNGGFYIVNPTLASIKFHKDILKMMMMHGINHQAAIGRGVKAMPELKYSTLDFTQFACGHQFFEKRKRMFLFDNPCLNESCPTYVVHNNWMFTKAAKVYRFKEMGMWIIDDKGYYSNPSNKYLQYSNPTDFGKKTKEKEKAALMTALTIARVLNRSVILPMFHCHGCGNRVCFIARDHCALNAQFEVSTFDKYFGDNYREHVFLKHPRVPDVVKRSVSNELHISYSQIPKTFKSSKDSYIFNATVFDNRIVTSEDIIKSYGVGPMSQLAVLNFHSFYVNVLYEDKSWRETLNRALQWSNYRQIGLIPHSVFNVGRRGKA